MTDYYFQQGTIIIISTTLILLTLLLNIVYRNIPGAKQYAFGSLLLQLAMLTFLSELSRDGYIPVLIIANISFILAANFQLEGISTFFGKPIKKLSIYSFSLILSMVYIYFTVIDFTTNAQLLIMNFGLSFYYIKIVMLFFGQVSKNYPTCKFFFIPALIFSISILISCGLNTLLPEGLTLTTFTNVFLSEGAFFITSLYIVGFFVMAAEYQRIKLRDYNIRILNESAEKTKLLKFINHEVRNHLSSISMKIEIMKDNNNYASQPELIEDIQLIYNVTHELELLTTDIMKQSNYYKSEN